MTLTIENTSKIVEVNGVPARIWEGTTAGGIAVVCFITRIAVVESENCTQFDEELRAERSPSAASAAIPLRLIL